MDLTRLLFRAARTSADVKALSSGDPKKIARRARNKAIGRGMAKAGFWRRLWK
jgi:muconolactone delta-isomerase